MPGSEASSCAWRGGAASRVRAGFTGSNVPGGSRVASWPIGGSSTGPPAGTGCTCRRWLSGLGARSSRPCCGGGDCS
eukprot:12919155-Prorocentrum_lima.AAC.1